MVSAALLCRYRQLAVRYWKPIQTGIDQDDDTAEVRRLSACDPTRILDAGIRLPRPVSPHLAAKLNGSAVDVDALIALAEGQPADLRWIVEGAGGILVPLSDQVLLVDVIGRLKLPVLVVARSGLGTINHTLLTIEALARRSMRIAGVVMVGPPDAENRLAIEHHGGITVVGELPIFAQLTPSALGQWADRAFDVNGCLMDYLT
ncbi:MAG: dethiobiotin synthase [Vicinamibacterales bacterium]